LKLVRDLPASWYAQFTPQEQKVLRFSAAGQTSEWLEQHAQLILMQAREIGTL